MVHGAFHCTTFLRRFPFPISREKSHVPFSELPQLAERYTFAQPFSGRAL
jgi:hypothetical protein